MYHCSKHLRKCLRYRKRLVSLPLPLLPAATETGLCVLHHAMGADTPTPTLTLPALSTPTQHGYPRVQGHPQSRADCRCEEMSPELLRENPVALQNRMLAELAGR